MVSSVNTPAPSTSSAASNAASLAGKTPSIGTGQPDAAASQDRFLKLLVAQLNNQDPMSPMDNAQMTSQIAQINTVSGIEALNETVKNLASQFSSMQILQGASMVGRGILVAGNTLSIENGVAKGAIDLSGNADKVMLEVQSPGGETLDLVNLGAMTSGRHEFSWDASNYKGTGNPIFKITATQGKSAVSSTPLARDTVDSVGMDNGAMTVQLKGRSAVAYSDIKAIL